MHQNVKKLLESDRKDLGKELAMGADLEPTTYIDKFAEDFVIKKITEKYKCTIFSEELGVKNFGDQKLVFIIDPIDGTCNAEAKLPFFTCSIAVLINTKLVTGIVRDLYNGDCFSAIKGQGAYLNDKQIRTNQINSLSKSIGIIALPTSPKETEIFNKLRKVTKRQRVISCPSLSVCYLAAGKIDLFVEIFEQSKGTIMDIAAAKIILEEAGGKLMNELGEEINLVLDPTFKTNFVAYPSSLIRGINEIFVN